MKFRRPNDFIIGDTHWRIEIKKDLGSTKKSEIVGLCNPETCVISIKKGLTDEDKWETLAHEILHAFEFSYDFELGHKIINKIQKSLGEFLRDNCHFL